MILGKENKKGAKGVGVASSNESLSAAQAGEVASGEGGERELTCPDRSSRRSNGDQSDAKSRIWRRQTMPGKPDERRAQKAREDGERKGERCSKV